MPSVFLSYSRKDLEPAILLNQQLTSRGLTVWRDEEKLRAGKLWPKELGEAIAASDALLLLWSEEAAKSPFVELEWTTAFALRKQILPCLIDQTPLPASLAAIQTIPYATVLEQPASIQNALNLESSPDLRRNTKQVIDQLAAIRSTEVSEVLKEFRTIQGSVYQAGRDIYIGATPNKWPWVAVTAALLVVVGLVLWRGYAPSAAANPVPTKTPVTPHDPLQEQIFAGSVWNAANEPLAGVSVSLLLGERRLDTNTDNIGRYTFRVAASPEAEITLIAHKDGYQTEKRYAQLGNTNFNFTMTGDPR